MLRRFPTRTGVVLAALIIIVDRNEAVETVAVVHEVALVAGSGGEANPEVIVRRHLHWHLPWVPDLVDQVDRVIPVVAVAAVARIQMSRHVPREKVPVSRILTPKINVGNLDPSVSQEHLFALFNPFGQLEQGSLQKQANGISKGFAFLQFRDPKEVNLALQTMAGQSLAGRPLKTGWKNQVSSNPSIEVVTSQGDHF
jgi:hypothetical protein